LIPNFRSSITAFSHQSFAIGNEEPQIRCDLHA
jgi:hypothetical protein